MESIILNTIYSSKLIIIFFLISCGQVVMDDDKLEEKSIVEAGGGINVISINPAINDSLQGDISQTFTIELSSSIQDCNDISPFATGGNSDNTSCSNQAIQLYKNTDALICAMWEPTTSPVCNTNKQIKVTLPGGGPRLAGKWTLKIPANTIYSSDFSSFVKEYTAQYELY